MFTSRWFSLTIFMTANFSLLTVSVHASGVRVTFDTSRCVECRDVTTDEFAASHPHEKLMEARVSISALAFSARESDVTELLYRVSLPDPGYQIVDYSPRTTMASGFTGNIEMESNAKESKSLRLDFSGQYGLFAKGDAHAASDLDRTANWKGQLRPPQELIAASGTVGGGTGLFFKLRPSHWTSLEGAKDFVFTVRVPRNWRGDYAIVQCQAAAVRRDVPFSDGQPDRCGYATYVIGLYAEGDTVMQDTARRMVTSEQSMRRQAASIDSTAKRSGGKPWSGIAEWIDGDNGNRTASEWVDQLVFGTLGTGKPTRAPLPAPVRRSAESFLSAREQLHQANQFNLATSTGSRTLASSR